MTQLYKKNRAVAPAFCHRQIKEKTKDCENCKYRLKVLEMETLDFDKDELREPCNVCNNYDRWEIYK